MPGILLGDVLPNFEAETTIGKIKFHEFLGNSWGILFSHPRDFTPVCTTELARAAKLHEEFKKRDVKMIALSIDSVEDHRKWSEDIMSFNQDKACCAMPFPIIADDKRELSVLLGMLDPDERDKDGMPLTARCVFVVGPDKRLKLSILYPATTGRNFDEILRVIDSLQLTATKKVATPVDWKLNVSCKGREKWKRGLTGITQRWTVQTQQERDRKSRRGKREREEKKMGQRRR
uniref:Peroxiredoxin-6 n=1 Tax=Cyprinus carpio TaxID=7962 RepID=A0A8C2ADZ7_CYPCA